jgi:ribonucleoside-diphosphate reductase alpha chain
MVPTGTIGIVMDLDTFGIEPDFSLVTMKKLSDGSKMMMINNSISKALLKLGYKDIDEMTEKIVQKNTVVGIVKSEHESIFDCAMSCSKGRNISVDGHILMLSEIIPNISMSISKTVNIPNSASIDDILNIYDKAWKLGIKSVAIYRDGSKFSQPLSSVLDKSEEREEKNIVDEIKQMLENAK